MNTSTLTFTNPFSFAVLLVAMATFSFASLSRAEGTSPNNDKACENAMHTGSAPTPDAFFTSDAELALLNDKTNGVAAQMLSAWVEASGVPLKTDHFLDVSLAAIKAKYLNVTSAANMDERRKTHTPVRKDGSQLARGTSQRSVERLADLWKQLAIELYPHVKTSIITKEAVDEMIAVLQNPPPIVEEVPEVPKAEIQDAESPVQKVVVLPPGAVSGTVVREFYSVTRKYTNASWYTPGIAAANFADLLGRLASPYEMTKLQPVLEKINFITSDVRNALLPGKAQGKFLSAVRLIAHILSPETAKYQSNDKWLSDLTVNYEKRMLRLELQKKIEPSTKKQLDPPLVLTPEPEPVPEPVDEIPEVTGPVKLTSFRVEDYKKDVKVRGPLGTDSPVKLAEGVSDFRSLAKSIEFIQFMRNFAQYSIPSGMAQGMMYTDKKTGTLYRVAFRSLQSPDGGPIEIRVESIKSESPKTDIPFYGAVANYQQIEDREYSFTGGRILILGEHATSSVVVPRFLNIGIRIQNHLSEDELKSMIINLREFWITTRGNYRGRAQIGDDLYAIFIDFTDGKAVLKSVFRELEASTRPTAKAQPVSGEVKPFVRVSTYVPAYERFQKSKDFANFMRDYSQFAIPNDDNSSEKLIIYEDNISRQSSQISFVAVQDAQGGPVEISIRNVVTLPPKTDGSFYFKSAQIHQVERVEYYLPNGRVLIVGNDQAFSIRMTARNNLRFRMKHQIDEEQLRKIVLSVRKVESAQQADTYSADVEVSQSRYKVYLTNKDHQIQVTNIVERR